MWLQRLNHWLWSVVIGLGILVYVVEEWLWEMLTRATTVLGRAPVIRPIESWIARLPPAAAAFFFALPATLALPVKLLAVQQIVSGHLLRGVLIIVAANLIATALFARIYVLTEPALTRVAWFVRLRAAFLHWRAWAYAQIEAHPLWRQIHVHLVRWRSRHGIRHGRKGAGRRRWRAWQRWYRARMRQG
jgi:hypothetical protein